MGVGDPDGAVGDVPGIGDQVGVVDRRARGGEGGGAGRLGEGEGGGLHGRHCDGVGGPGGGPTGRVGSGGGRRVGVAAAGSIPDAGQGSSACPDYLRVRHPVACNAVLSAVDKLRSRQCGDPGSITPYS